MNYYTPTTGIKETGRNARAFVKANQQLCFKILKPLLPYILALNLLDAVITGLFYKDPKDSCKIGSLIAIYFFSFLLISWHRVVIQGPDRLNFADPLKPTHNELSFICMPIGVVGIYIIAAGLIFGALSFISKELLIFMVFITVIGFIYGILRLSLYFPGKAIDADMTIKKAWHLTNGYIWKIFASHICASWRILLLNTLYSIAMVALAGLSAAFIFHGTGILFMLFVFIMQLPILMYFSPLIGALGVTVLSNFYLIAVNAKAAPTSPPA